MRAPNIAYQFTSPTDTAGPSFEIFNHHERISTGVTLMEFLVGGIAKDRVLVLSNACAFGQPDPVQFIRSIELQYITQAGLNVLFASDFVEEAAGIDKSLNWSGEIWIQGGNEANFLRVLIAFNTNALSNTGQVGFSGIIVPRGNAGAF